MEGQGGASGCGLTPLLARDLAFIECVVNCSSCIRVYMIAFRMCCRLQLYHRYNTRTVGYVLYLWL